MRSGLIIARAGDNSLHPRWLQEPHRTGDLAISFFVEEAIPSEQECLVVERESG